MSKKIEKYDENNNLIYEKYSSGYEEWYKYDKNNNCVHFKNSYGYEYWYKYDENNRIDITEKEYKEIEYNSRTKCSRFEIMDI